MISLISLLVLGVCTSLEAGSPTRKTYTISTDGDHGAMHVTKLSAVIPAWSEQLDKQGSPEFRKDPAGMFAVINVLQGTPDSVIKVLFGDAKSPTKTTAAGRTWIVDKQADGHVHAALFFAAADGYVVMCETRHDPKKLDLLADVKKMCDTIELAK
jgi:hypothetical protein